MRSERSSKIFGTFVNLNLGIDFVITTAKGKRIFSIFRFFRKIVDDFVKSEALRATLNNVHAIEMNSVRPLLTHSLDQIHRLGRLNF